MLNCELLRRLENRTQAEIAQAMGVHQVVVSNIELGRRPTAEQLKALGRVFNVEPAEDLLLPVSAEAYRIMWARAREAEPRPTQRRTTKKGRTRS